MTAEPIIRIEEPGDAAAIHALVAAAFPTDAEARLVDALRAAERLQLSLVAEQVGELVGHVAFSPVDLRDASATGGTGLAPVAVAASHRRRGIADRLIREGLARCRSAGLTWVVVLGDPAYYGRFGFVPASRHGLADTYGGGDAFQVLALVDDGLPSAGGTVHYAPEFDELE